MKKIVLLIILVVSIASLVIAICLGSKGNDGVESSSNFGGVISSESSQSPSSSAGTQGGDGTLKEEVAPTKEYITQCLENIPGIIEYEFVTEETDPMNNINKPGWYIEHVYFSYILVNQSDVYGDTLIDKGTEAGGSIEVYTTKENAIRRNEYLSSFDGTVLTSGSHTVFNFCVVRTSDELTATQQKFLENNIIYALKGEKDKIQNLNLTPNESDIYGYSKGLEFKINSDNKSYSLAGIGSCADKNIRIPKTYNDLPVNKVAKYCFQNNSDIVSVEIPGSIEVIMDSAFENCSNLESVKILNGTKSIGASTFDNCTNLTTVEISAGIITIGEKAFYRCANLSNVNYLGSIDEWAQIDFASAFSNPVSYSHQLIISGKIVTEIKLNMAKNISAYAFYDYDTLISVEIGDNVKQIGENAFYACANLSSVIVGDSVTIIEKKAFWYCGNLINIELGDNVEFIGEEAFYNCWNLKSLNIGDRVIIIDKRAFYSCDKLESVEFGAKLEYINEYAFSDCSSLINIEIGDSVKTIGEWAFYNCQSITSISIGDGVEIIGLSAFNTCSNLICLELDRSLKFLDENAFYNCDKIATVNYLGTIDGWAQINFGNEHANPVNYAKTLKIKGELVTSAKLLTTTNVSAYAFYNCDSIISVDVNDCVNSIGEYAFYNCDKIATVNYLGTIDGWAQINFGNEHANPVNYAKTLKIKGELVTSAKLLTTTNVSAYAFYNCDSIISVELGKGVTTIGKSAFSSCSRLVEVINNSSYLTVERGNYFYNGAIGAYAIFLYNSGDNFTKSNLVTDENGFITYQMSSNVVLLYYIGEDEDVIVPSNVTEIREYAFAWNDTIKTVNIDNKVLRIGYCAFAWCNNLQSVKFSDVSTWYVVDNYYDSLEKINGKQVDVNNSSRNITLLLKTYSNYYWYKK